jgi:hypothetical protein
MNTLDNITKTALLVVLDLAEQGALTEDDVRDGAFAQHREDQQWAIGKVRALLELD